MARQEVVQVRCDRCKRVQLLPPAPPKEKPDFEARIKDTVLIYEDLCSGCESAIRHTWIELTEWDREVKHQFGPTVQDQKAAPLTPAPDYSPPKPHSAAAGTKR